MGDRSAARIASSQLRGDVELWGQAWATWQWYNFAAQRVPEGKAVLRINVDETSVCLYQGDQKGTIFFNPRKRPRSAEPVQRAGKAQKRTCLTHIAFICDRPDVQPVLPQVIVGNCATFKAGQWQELLAVCPGSVWNGNQSRKPAEL